MNELNLLCYKFQKEIIDSFNKTEIPFLLKYYLFKQIWETIDNKKTQIQITTENYILNEEQSENNQEEEEA